MERERIYLDYAATTPLRPQARAAMEPHLGPAFGNPSSIHAYGREARVAVEAARRELLQALGAPRAQLVFTGSGSEADNLALLGFARRHPGGCVIHSSVEHKAVLRAAAALAAAGYDVREAPVDRRGVLELDAFAGLLPRDGRPTLASVMWANNETGVIQPLAAVGELCRARSAALHSDAVQAFGKVPVDPEAAGVDLLALAAHKIGGPKGIGALLVRGGIELEPLVYGGGQEAGLRAGTENVASVVGFAAAAAAALAEREREAARHAALRDRLASGLRAALPDIVVNGGDAPERLPGLLNVSVPGVDIEGLLTALDLDGICVSSGSACTTGSVEASHVLTAMGRRGDLAENAVRLSLGWGTRAEEIDEVLRRFPRIVSRLREIERRA